MKTMKMTVIAGLIFTIANVVSAGAQSLTITTGDSPRYHRSEHFDRGMHMGEERGYHRRDYHRPRCVTKSVESRRHGRVMVKETRVCR